MTCSANVTKDAENLKESSSVVFQKKYLNAKKPAILGKQNKQS